MCFRINVAIARYLGTELSEDLIYKKDTTNKRLDHLLETIRLARPKIRYHWKPITDRDVARTVPKVGSWLSGEIAEYLIRHPILLRDPRALVKSMRYGVNPTSAGPSGNAQGTSSSVQRTSTGQRVSSAQSPSIGVISDMVTRVNSLRTLLLQDRPKYVDISWNDLFWITKLLSEEGALPAEDASAVLVLDGVLTLRSLEQSILESS